MTLMQFFTYPCFSFVRTDISTNHIFANNRLKQLLMNKMIISGRFKDEAVKTWDKKIPVRGYVEFYRNELKNLSAWMETRLISRSTNCYSAAALEHIDATPMEDL